MPAKGGAATQITRGLAWDRRPVWSPDGNLLAYISDGTGSDNVWVVEADGTNPRSVADEDELGLEGAEWQRNGHRIVVARRSNVVRSEEHTSELQSLMRISYAVFCLKKQNYNTTIYIYTLYLIMR